MTIQKYSVNQHPIQTVISWIKSKEIAIPEIQRPFVWEATKVRDLIDSLYSGYPVGYLIAWRNPNVKLKDGSTSTGKRILIDGQQRVTALMTSLLGETVINKDYKRNRITIAFHPQDIKFEVSNPAIRKDKAWIPDIAQILSPKTKIHAFVKEYCKKNTPENDDEIYESVEALRNIVNNPIGLIDINSDLDIEAVTEIFIRINSKGAVLSQADFAMSKIASSEKYGGSTLRKCIDYFCHMAVAPDFHHHISEEDREFASTEHFSKMAWLKNENDDLYDPSYVDMLRVTFTSEFKRGRLRDLVALLSGRDFTTREYKETIAEDSFKRLEKGIFNFMNEAHFKRFVMILQSAGFIDASMIRAQNPINFAYIVYLALRAQNTDAHKIESYVRRWFVMSVLTGRYSGSPETTFDTDIKKIDEIGIEAHLQDVEAADLSDAFWSAALPQQLNTSVASSPYFNVYMAAQVKMNDKGFLSRDISVQDLIEHKGDVHHVFPKNYLKRSGLTRNRYNQIANYVLMQSEINIKIGDKAPCDYFSTLLEQCKTGNPVYGGITDIDQLRENLVMHCLPNGMEERDKERYDEFLAERRKLMSEKTRKYYQGLT